MVVTLAAFKPDATMHGIAALVSTSRTGPANGHLIGGTFLQSGSGHVTSPVASHRGVIESITSKWDGAADNAFITAATLPTGETLRGTWMHVTLGAGATTETFEIDHLSVRDGRTWIHLQDDPGLRTQGNVTREIFFPRREFTGMNHFTIHTRCPR
jgi:hypothetical protein